MKDDVLRDIKDSLENITATNLQLLEKLYEHDIRFAEYNGLLREHIKRTELLEEETRGIKKELEPVKDHVKAVRSLKNVILFVSSLVVATLSVLKLIGKI